MKATKKQKIQAYLVDLEETIEEMDRAVMAMVNGNYSLEQFWYNTGYDCRVSKALEKVKSELEKK